MPYRYVRKGKVRRRPARGRGLTKHQRIQVKRLVTRQQEIKAIDTGVLQSPTAAGLCQVLTMPPQGDSLSTRDGDEIVIKKLQFRLNIIIADTTNIVRLIVFRWADDNTLAANIPTPNQVLQSLNVASFYNYTTHRDGQVQVMYDRTWALSSAGVQDRFVKGSIYGKKLGKKKIVFDAAVITGNDQIYYLLISDSVGAPHPSVGGVFRMTYTDS